MKPIAGLSVLCVCLALAQPARAQTAPPSALFAEGTVFAGLEYRNYTNYGGTAPLAPSENPTDQVLGAGFSVGTFLGSNVSARFEVAMLSETALHTETRLNEIQTSTVDRFISGQTFSVLAAYHPPSSGRVRMAYLGGVAFVRLTEEFIQQLRREELPSLPATLEIYEGRQVVYGPTAMLGLDAAVRLGGHIDLVPQIRITSANSLSVRPGISLRWRR